jgi:hypothetical protein
MASSSLFFVPFPRAESNPVSCALAITSLFQSEGPQMQALSRQTKDEQSWDRAAFIEYSQCLYAARGARFECQWSSPFQRSPAVLVKSQVIEAEIFGTLWNFIAFSHARLLTMDATTREQLIEVREPIRDCLAAIEDIRSIVGQFQHSFFNDKLVNFTEKYHNFLVAVWQQNCGICAGKGDPFSLARYSTLCYNILRECVIAVRALEAGAQQYFRLIIEALENYFGSYVRWNLGESDHNKQERGDALANYKAGLTQIESFKCPIVDSRLTLLRANLQHALQVAVVALESEQKRFFVAKTTKVPDFPAPAPTTALTPSEDVLFQDLLPGLDPVEIQSGVPGRSTGGRTSGAGRPSVRPAAGAGAPPAYTPPGGPPAYTPPVGPAWYTPPGLNASQGAGPVPYAPPAGPPQYKPPGPPQYKSPGPPQGKPTGRASAKVPSGPSVFPEWDALRVVRDKVKAKLQQLIASPTPKISAIASQFANAVSVAEHSDQIVQERITAFNNKKDDFSREDIEVAIAQSSEFYSNLEERLNRLEVLGE